mgnify:CR=1 FL=1
MEQEFFVSCIRYLIWYNHLILGKEKAAAMESSNYDPLHLMITAVVSLVVTIAIVFMMDTISPGLIISKGGTSVFIFIGVFSANLIIEACHRRIDKNIDNNKEM